MTSELASAAQEWLTYALIFSVQLLIVLALRKPVRARFGAVACYRLWLLPLLWLPFYVAGPGLFAAFASFVPAVSQDAMSSTPALQQFIDLELLPFPLDPAGVSELSAGGSPVFQKWTLLALILASGTCALIVWHGYRWLNFLRHVDALAAPLTQAERERTGAAMDAFTNIPVVRLPCMNSAALFGVFKPVLLLPESFSERYDSGQRHIILAHEAVHLRRHDNAWNLLALLLIALFWFNPLLFVAWRCFRLDQELSCDALALARCNKEQQGRYARTLLASLASAVPSTNQPALSAWNSLGDIKERSLMIKHHLQNAARPFATLFSLLGCALFGASLTVAAAGLISPPAQAADAEARADAQPPAQPVAQQAVQPAQQPAAQAPRPVQRAQVAQPAAQAPQPVEQAPQAADQAPQPGAQSPQVPAQGALQAQPVQIAQRAQDSTGEARAREEAERAQRAAEEARLGATRQAEAAKAAAREAAEVALAAERTAREAEQAAREAEKVAEEAERAAREAERAAREAAEAAQRAEQQSKAPPASPRLRASRTQEGPDQVIDAQTGRILTEAIRLLNEDRFEEVRAELGKLRVDRMSPFERSRLHQLLFNLEMHDEDYSGAREQLQLALESGGLNERERSQIRYQLAQLHVQEENYGAAVAALEAWIAAEAAPTGAAHYLLAASYYYLGQFDRALPNAEKAIELAGENGPHEGWLSLLASLYIEQKKFAEAEDVVTDMVGLYPQKETYRKQLADLQKLNALR